MKLRHRAAAIFVIVLAWVMELRVRFRSRPGVTAVKREIPVIISMTSISNRLKFVHLTLETLLSQSEKPDRIILWLDERLSSQIPPKIKSLKRRGVEIIFRRDIGVFTKEYYALMELPGSVLVTADDDWMYPRDWLKDLYSAYLLAPEQVHCHGSRLMSLDENGRLTPHRSWKVNHGISDPSFLIFPLTGQGVLFPPGSLHEDALDLSLLSKLTPTNDDIWLKAMSLLNGRPCKMVAPICKNIFGISGTQENNLYAINKSLYDEYFQNIFLHYDLMDIMRSESTPQDKTRRAN